MNGAHFNYMVPILLRKMQRRIKAFWNFISHLGVENDIASVELKRRVMINKLVFFGLVFLFPFMFPGINPTSSSFGWIEFGVFLGLIGVLILNGFYLIQWGRWALLLTMCSKIFFTASVRGIEGGDQFFILPVSLGILLIHDLKKNGL